MVSKVGLQIAAEAQDADVCPIEHMNSCHKSWKHAALPALSAVKVSAGRCACRCQMCV